MRQLQQEFKGYNGQKLAKDLMAGLTVAAVALPLALAFGVSAGATAEYILCIHGYMGRMPKRPSQP